jgi:hypothetical protein
MLFALVVSVNPAVRLVNDPLSEPNVRAVSRSKLLIRASCGTSCFGERCAKRALRNLGQSTGLPQARPAGLRLGHSAKD